MTVTNIYVRQEGEDEYLIGSVTPPTVNGHPIFSTDDYFRGQRSPEGKPVHIDDALADLWDEWREENPHPDTDSEFIEWLVEKGWTEHPVPHTFTIVI